MCWDASPACLIQRAASLFIDFQRCWGAETCCTYLLQVPVLRERLLHGKDWPAVAKQQKKAQFGAAAKQLAQERLKGMLESFEMMCQIEQQQQHLCKQQATGAASSTEACSLLDGGGAVEADVLAAPIKVVCSRQVGSSWCTVCFVQLVPCMHGTQGVLTGSRRAQ
jgi:hypothetical protein